MDQLIYQKSPVVTFATNQFINVPIILQYDSTPLISIVKEQSLGFTTEIPIYHSDGTYLAKVKGTRIYPTDDGKKAGLEMSHPPGMTVCKLGNRTVFEIHHEQGDAFRAHAELHTPDGYFVKSAGTFPQVISKAGAPLQIGGLIMSHNTIVGARIGVWVRSNGSCAIGVS
ncbi:MAG TPA: hypothetical protein VFS24_20345 [Steroidobacteraceae bacterium]|nr:hypothetical protein [Steroidobacteraceae bacterium]